MDLPQPPEDPELKTIIDKLANFVARNGHEFEQMTKNKQRENPKFSFLYGGEFFNYYQYKVTTEQAILNQQKQKMASAHAQLNMSQSASPWQQNEAIIAQIASLQEEINREEVNVQNQIMQSEQNLNAQYTSLTQTQQYQVDDVVSKARQDRVAKLSNQSGLSISDFDDILQPIIESCTKDAISSGKNWIFNRATNLVHFDFIASHLLNRILDREVTFEVRLHLIYLINDLLHHSQRKGIDQMKQQLARIVVPAFCTTITGVDEVKHQKLDKLLNLWAKNSYFNQTALDSMKDPSKTLTDYQAACVSEHSSVISNIAATIQQQYSALQHQHREYADHLTMQLQEKRVQLDQMQTQQRALATIVAASSFNTSIPPPGMCNMPPMMDPNQQPLLPPPVQMNQFNAGFGPPVGPPVMPLPFDPTIPPPNLQDMNQPPNLPDLSRPPPGFTEPQQQHPITEPQPPISDVNLIPSVPYYDLPAGLMCPLVKLSDSDYKPLDADKIRLPPPAPPTDRLIAAIEAFYSQPSHDTPRDAKGWERLGLYEYYKAKDTAKRERLERHKNGDISPSSSGGSPERSPSKSRSRSRSDSPVYRRASTSRSPSPRPYLSPRDNDRHHRRSRSRERTYNRPTPSERPRERSRSISLSPERNNETFIPPLIKNPNERLAEDNRGHMLMKKMGWSGKGLGATEQGMVEPIQGAEARDKLDMYSGIGVTVDDPFLQFRKKNSSGFIQKLRTRDEERKAAASQNTEDPDTSRQDPS